MSKENSEARIFADLLVTSYHTRRVSAPHLNTICIDLIDNFPEDQIMNGAIEILSARWTVELNEFKASSGRAGCVWMTPKPISCSGCRCS